MEFLNEVSIEFPETKEFIEERLEHKYSEENISQEEVIYLFIYFTSLEAIIFCCIILGFQARTCIFTRIAFN